MLAKYNVVSVHISDAAVNCPRYPGVMTAGRYHHGDLRRALLDKAFELFEARGNLDFSFRELARHAGVTHNAPYRHFAGKAELLEALTQEGLARLAKVERAALERAGDDPGARVGALGESYIRFALDEPTVFRLVFTGPIDHEGDANAMVTESYRILERTLADAQRAGAVRQDLRPRELALAAWAIVHGVASLLVSGRLPPKEEAVKRYIVVLATVFYDGARARPPAPR